MSFTLELPNGERTSRASMYTEWTTQDLLRPVYASVEVAHDPHGVLWCQASANWTEPDAEGAVRDIHGLNGAPRKLEGGQMDGALIAAMHEAVDLFLQARVAYDACPEQDRKLLEDKRAAFERKVYEKEHAARELYRGVESGIIKLLNGAEEA